MPAGERTLSVVAGWVQKAEHDLKNATLVLRAGRACPADTAAFHAQQCTEKYLKALLTFRAERVPRIHDVEQLLALTGLADAAGVSLEQQRLLTGYATITRYPGDDDPVSVAEARRAVALARRVRGVVRTLLPRTVQRTRRGGGA